MKTLGIVLMAMGFVVTPWWAGIAVFCCGLNMLRSGLNDDEDDEEEWEKLAKRQAAQDAEADV